MPAVPDLADLEALVGTALPDGRYVIEPEAHGRLVGALHAGDYDYDVAHPVFAHLAPHCGMGWTMEQFWALVEAPMDSGVLFGEGHLSYTRPIEIGRPYTIRGVIDEVNRKHGERAGTFDLVTLALELVDDDGDVVVTSRETYVFPRGRRGHD